MKNDPTVFIVDDDREVREALQLLMESVGLRVESFASAQEFLGQFDRTRPGCLVLDVRMPGMSGLDLQAKLGEQPIHPPVIIITGHGDVPMAVRAVQSGALDFIEKPFNDQSLLDSVHRALEKDGQQRGEASLKADIKRKFDRLTPRERQVLELVVTGKRNKVIATEMHVSQSTVEAHRAKVMEKMEAETLSDLMRMMISIEDLATG